MIEQLEYVHASNQVIYIIILLGIVVGVLDLLKTLWGIFAPKVLGIQTKISRRKEMDKLIISCQSEIKDLRERQDNDHKYSKDGDKEIKKNVTELKEDVTACMIAVTDMRISVLRKNILDFASSVANNGIYTKEYYDEIFADYEDYESLLKKRGLTNGRVELSMDIIRQSYKDNLLNHGFIDDKINEMKIKKKEDDSNV